MATYDYIVVGGGTAGCVLAARLSERPTVSVLLLEAGPADGPDGPLRAAMADPTQWSGLLGSAVDWAYTTTPQAALGGARLPLPAGRTLGGSSSINAMFHLRGHRSNYDAWAAAGTAGWGYEDLLPYFKRSEHALAGDERFRGRGGPMIVAPTPPEAASPLVRDFHTAARQAGYVTVDDVNGPDQVGLAWPEFNIVDGARQSAADAYLRPVLPRPNLTVVTDAHVHRLLIERGRCRAVEYTVTAGARTARDDEAGEHTVRVDAGGEVVLAAGTIGSAKLLLLSGVGPAEQLRGSGIDVVADLPGVGENLHDHVMTSVVFTASEQALPIVRNPAGSGLIGLLRTDPSVPEPDVQLVFTDAPYFSPALAGTRDAYVITCSLVKPVSRGTVRLAGPDPATPPLVDPAYLTDPRDVDRLLTALDLALAVGHRDELKPWREGEMYPGSMPRDGYLRAGFLPYFHLVGTCRMGGDPGAVTDARLRVRGVEGLRVADASVMPSIVSANTNATVLAIAERAAELIAAGN